MTMGKLKLAFIGFLLLSLIACGGSGDKSAPGKSPPPSTIPAMGSKAKGLAFDLSDNLYVSTESGRVVKLEGEVLSTFIPAGRGSLDLGKHLRFSQGHFYINNVFKAGTNLDAGVDEILLFTEAGTFVRRLLTELKDTSHIFHFEEIAVNAQGQLYMAGFGLSSSSPKQVVRVDANGQNFAVLPIVGEGGMGAPTSLSIDSKGDLYVGDFGKVSKFDTNGTFPQKIVERGTGNSGFESATHLAVDREDNLYIGNLKGAGTTSPTWNLLKFDSNGVFQGEVVSAGASGLSHHPEEIGFDSQGFLYIADDGVGGVIRFTPAGSFDRVVVKNFAEGNQGEGNSGGDRKANPSVGIYTCWTAILIFNPVFDPDDLILPYPWPWPSFMGVIEIQADQNYRTSPLQGDDPSYGTFRLDEVLGWSTFIGGGLDSLVAAYGRDSAGLDFLRFRLSSPQNPGSSHDLFDHICYQGEN